MSEPVLAIDAIRQQFVNLRRQLDALERELSTLPADTDGTPTRPRDPAAPVVDTNRRAVIYQGTEVVLGETRTFGLLRMLLERPGWHIAFTTLREKLWAGSTAGDDAIEQAASALRKRLRAGGLPRIADAITVQNFTLVLRRFWEDDLQPDFS